MLILLVLNIFRIRSLLVAAVSSKSDQAAHSADGSSGHILDEMHERVDSLETLDRKAEAAASRCSEGGSLDEYTKGISLIERGKPREALQQFVEMTTAECQQQLQMDRNKLAISSWVSRANLEFKLASEKSIPAMYCASSASYEAANGLLKSKMFGKEEEWMGAETQKERALARLHCDQAITKELDENGHSMSRNAAEIGESTISRKEHYGLSGQAQYADESKPIAWLQEDESEEQGRIAEDKALNGDRSPAPPPLPQPIDLRKELEALLKERQRLGEQMCPPSTHLVCVEKDDHDKGDHV